MNKLSKAFIEERMSELEQFLQGLAHRWYIYMNDDFKAFLDPKDKVRRITQRSHISKIIHVTFAV